MTVSVPSKPESSSDLSAPRVVVVASSNFSRCRNNNYIIIPRYCVFVELRTNVAGQIRNRVSPAESAFSARIGTGSSQSILK